MKLKSSQIKPTRVELLGRQGLKCALCGLELPEEKAVLDHSHKSGAIRATLHRGCNSLLGKIENNVGRYGVDVLAFAAGLHKYISTHQIDRTGLVHPTFFTPEERKVRTVARAKKARLKRRLNKS